MKSILTLLAITICTGVMAQVVPQLSSFNIAPASPAASTFQKFGDYPVDLSSGIPNISVPLYEIKTPRFTIPISISYHARGFKPSQEVGVVGLGWSLSPDLRISRMVQSAPDEFSRFPYPIQTSSQIDLFDAGDREYLRSLDLDQRFGGLKDSEYDIFYYDLLSGGGKFFIYPTGSVGENGVQPKRPATSPYRPLKITSDSDYNNSPINYFDIIDEKGDIYRFAATETAVPNIHDPDIDYRSGWLITQIISNDKSDTITFKYENWNRSTSTKADLFIVTDNIVAVQTRECGSSLQGCTPIGSNGAVSSVTTTSTTTSNYFGKRLSEIYFRGGSLKLEYGPGGIGEIQFLTKIRIRNRSGQTERSVEFNQARFGTNTQYYKLSDLRIVDAASSVDQIYSFTYEEDNASSVPTSPITNSGIDRWGFYNGKQAQNLNLLPNWTIQPSTGLPLTAGSANRESDEQAMKTFSLKSIKYPTGGETQFVFEGNRMYYGTGTYRIVGGLRIKQFINVDPLSNVTTKKTYKYGSSESGNGNLTVNPYDINRFTQQYFDIKLCTWCSSGLLDNQNLASTARITVISSDFSDGSGLFEMNPVFYTHVSEYIGDEITNTGKTQYVFDEPVNGYTGNDPGNTHLQVVSDWRGRNLIERTVFENTGGTYSEVEKEVNVYNKKQVYSLQGMKVVSNLFGKSTANDPSQDLFFYTLYQGVSAFPAYRYYDYTITTGISELSSQTVTRDGVQTVGTFTYGTVYPTEPYHNEPLNVTQAASNGTTVQNVFKYPHEMTGLTGVALEVNNIMKAQNLILPIEETYSSNGSSMKKINNFSHLGNGLIKLNNEQTSANTQPPETRIEFVGYDGFGNLQVFRKTGDVTTSVLWGYRNAYPIAEARNATFNSVKEIVPSQNALVFNGLIPNNDAVEQLLGAFTINSQQGISWTGTIARSNSKYTVFKIIFKNSLGSIVYEADYSGIIGSIAFTPPVYNYDPNTPLPSYVFTPGRYSVYYTYDRDEPETPNLQLQNFTITNILQKPKYHDNVFHTSFEEDGSIDASARTGTKVKLGTFSLPMPAVTGKYNLTYWTRTGTTGQWVYTSEIVDVTSSSLPDRVVGNASTYIDEIRFYPEKSMMTTYTYNLLWGVSCITDENSISTYFEYDTNGRFSTIKDNDRNIVKYIEYHQKN